MFRIWLIEKLYYSMPIWARWRCVYGLKKPTVDQASKSLWESFDTVSIDKMKPKKTKTRKR